MYWNRITDQSTSKPLSRLHFNDYGCQEQLNANIRTHALLKPQKRTLMKLWVFPMEIRIFTRLYFSMLPLSLSGNEAISFCWKYSNKSLLCFGPCLWQSLLFVYAVLGMRWTRVLKWSSSQKQARYKWNVPRINGCHDFYSKQLKGSFLILVAYHHPYIAFYIGQPCHGCALIQPLFSI